MRKLKHHCERMRFCGLLVVCIFLSQGVSTELAKYSFPENFSFAVATAAYQVEGGFNEDGKSETDWDDALQRNPSLVMNEKNANIASDSYHKWQEDVKLLKELGTQFYRFSIAWTRILPAAYKDTEVNEKGVAYYNNLIDQLLSEGIQPIVTIFHWDLPLILQEDGGWLNPDIIEHYIFYAKTAFRLFGDRVKHWITFNEPYQFCENGYSESQVPPFLNASGIGGYACSHNVLLAHGRTYREYERLYKKTQGGLIAITADSVWFEPKEDLDSHRAGSERILQFTFGRYLHPLIIGNYPPVMIQRIDEISRNEGYTESRLPKFKQSEIEMLRGTLDYIGLNHYTTSLVEPSEDFIQPSQQYDYGVKESADPKWQVSNLPWLRKVPWALRKLLVWIKKEYGDAPIFITENGWSNIGGLDDTDRIEYLNEYLSEVLKAIHEDGCNVIGYTVWSLIDTFEWRLGYWAKYGLVDVDFSSPERTRTPRKSYYMYKEIIKSRKLNEQSIIGKHDLSSYP